MCGGALLDRVASVGLQVDVGRGQDPVHQAPKNGAPKKAPA